MPLDVRGDTFQGLAKMGFALDHIDQGVYEGEAAARHLSDPRFDNIRGNLNVIAQAAAGLREAAVAILAEEEPEILQEVKDLMASTPDDALDAQREESAHQLAVRVALTDMGL
jgi:hypothetical protein